MINEWVYKIKIEPDGTIRFKVRPWLRDTRKRRGFKIFSPVMKLTTIRILLSIVAVETLHLEQMDVTNNLFTR